MEYQIRIKPRAEKELVKIPKKDYYKILSRLSVLCRNPFSGKKLKGEYRDCYSLCVWPYRIIYQIYQQELLILIVSIGHRQGVYK